MILQSVVYIVSNSVKGSLRMKIEVRNRAELDSFNLIDEVHINENLNSSALLSSRPSYYAGIRQRVRLRLSFRVICSEDCASPSANCSIYCHTSSNNDDHSGFNIVHTSTSDCSLSGGASNIGCGSLSNFNRSKRG